MKNQGFTLIEILIVVAIIGLIFSVTIPVSYDLYESYKNSLKAQEVMLYISSLKREGFLYSEQNYVSSSEGALIINGDRKSFPGVYIDIKKPFKFFKNGTSDGGEIQLRIGREKYKIIVSAPFGELSVERLEVEKV